jgi:hypothetical protein
MTHTLTTIAAAVLLSGQSLYPQDVVRAALPVCKTQNFSGLFTLDIPSHWQVMKPNAALQKDGEEIMFLAILPDPHFRDNEPPRTVWLFADAKIKVSVYDGARWINHADNVNEFDLQTLAGIFRNLYSEEIRKESGMKVIAKKDVINDVSVISIKRSSPPDKLPGTAEGDIFENNEQLIFSTGGREFHVELATTKANQERIMNEIRNSLRLTRRR